MSASSMDRFVRQLLDNTSNLSTLSQRSVREAYMRSEGMTDLSEASRDLLKQIVNVLVEEKQEHDRKETKDAASEAEQEDDGDSHELEEDEDYESDSRKDKNDKRRKAPKDTVKKSKTGSKRKNANRLSAEEALEAVMENYDDSGSANSVSDHSESEYSCDDFKSRKKAGKSNKSNGRNGIKSNRSPAAKKPSTNRISAKKSTSKKSNRDTSDESDSERDVKRRKRLSSVDDVDTTDGDQPPSKANRKRHADVDRRTIAKSGAARQKSKTSRCSDSDASSNEEPLSSVRQRSINTKLSDDEVASSDEDFSERNKSQRSSEPDSDDDQFGGSADEIKLNKNKNKSSSSKSKLESSKSNKQNGKKRSRKSSLSDDESSSRAKKKKPKATKSLSAAPKEAKNTPGEEKDPHLKNLEKIARHCGALPVGRNYAVAFAECKTTKQRCDKVKQMLLDAGMEGIPSMKAAEQLKLEKETRELCEGSIINTEGRTKRNVFSIYSRNEYKPVARQPEPSLTSNFSNLRGIVDSDPDSD